MEKQLRIRAETWKVNELWGLVGVFEDKLAEAVEKQHVVIAEDYRNLLLYAAAKSTVTTRELCILCANGYPDGALSLARNIYEQFIVLAFLESKRKCSEFKDYINDYYVDADLQYCRMAKVQRTTMPEIEFERIVSIENAAKSQATRNTKGQYWWTGIPSFNSLVDYISKENQDSGLNAMLVRLHAMYKLACVELHSNSLGNHFRLGIDRSFAGIDTNPVDKGLELPLEFVSLTLIYIVGVVGAEFGIEYEEIAKPLNSLAAHYHTYGQV